MLLPILKSKVDDLLILLNLEPLTENELALLSYLKQYSDSDSSNVLSDHELLYKAILVSIKVLKTRSCNNKLVICKLQMIIDSNNMNINIDNYISSSVIGTYFGGLEL